MQNFMKNFLILFISVFALSQAGNLIRLCDAHAFTIAFYRLSLAFVILFPFTMRKVIADLKTSDAKTIGKIIFMGFIFAFHLIFWIKAVQYTKVANAAICYSILPVLISLGAFILWKEALHKNIVIAIIAGIAGIFLVGYDDFSASAEYLWGDFLAVISALLFAVYFLTGKSVRATKDNLFIMNLVYFFAAITGLCMVGIEQASLTGFTWKTKIGFILLALVPTILGHATFIYISKYMKASFTSTFILLEPVFAGLIAFIAFNEKITFLTLLGYLCILGGLLFLTLKREEAA